MSVYTVFSDQLHCLVISTSLFKWNLVYIINYNFFFQRANKTRLSLIIFIIFHTSHAVAPILVACHTANHAVMSKKQVVMEQVDEVINEVNCDKINE